MSGSLLGPAKVEVNGPEDEAVRAFVPTLRMFIQKNDDISVPKVDLIYESQAVPEGLRAEFAEARKTLNDFLDEDTMFVFIDETITRDRLRDVLMNGDLSHVEAPSSERLLSSGSDTDAFAPINNAFIVTLGAVCNCVQWIRDIDTRLLTLAD